MLHLFRRDARSAQAPGGPPMTAALEDDLGLLFAALDNPLGRPPARDWAAAAGARPGTPGNRRARHGRLAGGVLAGIGAVVLAAAGYTAVTTTGLADRMFANFGSAQGQPGVYPLGTSQTLDGVTVTVDHAVFDGKPVEEATGPNGPTVTYVPVMVQFTVSGLPGDVRDYSVTASAASGGQVLRYAGAVGLGGGSYSEVLQRELPPGTQQQLVAWDTTGLSLDSGSLPLHLEVTVTPHAPQDYQGGASPSAAVAVTPASGPNAEPIRFVFDVAVPTR